MPYRIGKESAARVYPRHRFRKRYRSAASGGRMDYYRILNIEKNASQEEIKKAYRKLSRKYHPDNAGEQAREQFDRVQEAYGVLGDEEKRAVYDERMRADGPGGRGAEKAAHGKNAGQPEQKEDVYKDLAAFYTGAYKNSFEKFFGAGMKKQTGQESGARPMNTDTLFESYFKCK